MRPRRRTRRGGYARARASKHLDGGFLTPVYHLTKCRPKPDIVRSESF